MAFTSRTSLFALLGTLLLSLPALAAPPAHAPAHGWRKQHDPYYQGYTGRKWTDDYGVISGRCDAGKVATIVGTSAAGAVIGGAVNDEKGALIGAIAGALIGAKLAQKTDDVDRGCVSHALDLGPADRPVFWTNPNTRQSYTVIPRAARTVEGRVCRDLDWGGGHVQTACLSGGGSWAIIGR